MIISEGFPAFERTIGTNRFKKLKKYYGIGCNADKMVLKQQELKELLAKLRTIENACYYIYGYWDAILVLNDTLDESNPIQELTERAQILSNAKLAFLAGEVLCGGWFPQMYFKKTGNAHETSITKGNRFAIKRRHVLPNWLPDYKLCNQRNDKTPYGPDALLYVADKFSQYEKGCIIVDQLMNEVERIIQNGLLDDVMRFCELRFYEHDGWNFCSCNIPNPYNTVEMVKELKRRVNPEHSSMAMEQFLLLPDLTKMDQEEVWTLYSLLSQTDGILEGKFPQVPARAFYANGITESTRVYKLTGTTVLAGTLEAKRCLELAQYVYEHDIPLPFAYTNEKVPAGQVLTAITLAQNLGCVGAYAAEYTTAPNYVGSASYAYSAMKIAKEIMGKDDKEILRRELLAEQKTDSTLLKLELGITDEILRQWGAENPEVEAVAEACVDVTADMNATVSEPNYSSAEANQHLAVDTVMNAAGEEPMPVADKDFDDPSQCMEFILEWARLKGYLVKSEVDEQQRQIIQAVIIDGNEKHIRTFATGECTEMAFMEAIGFEADNDIALEYFDRYQVARDELTHHCILINKKLRQKKAKTPAVKCTVRLYNYLVDRRIECGPDCVYMKRDKSLLNFKFPNDK